ncbi:peptidoglycan DD-metalloendopeptidase family protein [Maribellus comscasis]|uniref:Peptidoglycan DD-metalloendopeptidase family protein n=1 Tax=Maribellus comscasis TaxID=2681766 RepID=A0A6I6JVN4_9BACT|nr:peptidoglycan DD-metalloendopeptidase family protein [Maribellus comscasis]QGY44222.1 peptidoglycan DD-metalloendopeptidase family protein [Maribellus comscasis]
MKTLVVTSIVLFFVHTVCYAQSLSDLQKKKEEAAAEIEYTTKLLNEAEKSEKTSLNQLRLLNNQIHQRNIVINNTREEINVYQEFIDNNTLVVKMLDEDIQKLKEEYAEMIRSAYRNKNANDNVMFLLSAEDFNQAYRRYLYLKQYTSQRKTQAETINSVQEVLTESSKKLAEQKVTRQQLIGETREETQKLTTEKQQQNQELQKLQKQQRSLRQKLNQQRRVEQQLEDEIQRIIEEEARKNTDAGAPAFALAPEQKLVGDNFEQNKRLLPWPVERGVITEHFGIHSHPILKNVQIRNNGINIATETGSKVRAIFNGEVTRVFGITGGNTAVIIRHGNYLTVYSNLREVVVKKGDMVATKQIIGTVFTDLEDGNKSILKFQIWRENQKLNPEEWIVK